MKLMRTISAILRSCIMLLFMHLSMVFIEVKSGITVHRSLCCNSLRVFGTSKESKGSELLLRQSITTHPGTQESRARVGERAEHP